MNNRVQQDHEKYEQCKSESEICWQAAKVQNAPGESKYQSSNMLVHILVNLALINVACELLHHRLSHTLTNKKV